MLRWFVGDFIVKGCVDQDVTVVGRCLGNSNQILPFGLRVVNLQTLVTKVEHNVFACPAKFP